jgi:hypothetical protein
MGVGPLSSGSLFFAMKGGVKARARQTPSRNLQCGSPPGRPLLWARMTTSAVTAVFIALWCQDPKANFRLRHGGCIATGTRVLRGGGGGGGGTRWVRFARRVAGSVAKVLRERHFAVLVLAVLEIMRPHTKKC